MRLLSESAERTARCAARIAPLGAARALCRIKSQRMDADALGAFERAAEEVQSGDEGTRTAAEAVLLALRESPAVVASSQAVLSQTSSAVAQFQALLALKEGVLREWGTTAPAQVDALRTQVRAMSLR